ncbi:hypothetical protein B0T18DRAFT_66218 [Schizothecium vesticola]|uniref:Uncharacterized protein n=1 Tax=Schizothecium vesticola TaxID=314040 RepID=A0AA40KAD0_9PEZI|nr:hypothetical protein B0T18DRAFT_66218 [Schizothecium vesticola]
MRRSFRLTLPNIPKPLSATPGLLGRHRPLTAPPTTPTSSISQVPYSTSPSPKTQPSQDTQTAPFRQTTNIDAQPTPPPAPQKAKTQSQLDEELRNKMEGLSGDGGASGVEYEDGQPVAMKRSVKDNMFRYI